MEDNELPLGPSPCSSRGAGLGSLQSTAAHPAQKPALGSCLDSWNDLSFFFPSSSRKKPAPHLGRPLLAVDMTLRASRLSGNQALPVPAFSPKSQSLQFTLAHHDQSLSLRVKQRFLQGFPSLPFVLAIAITPWASAVCPVMMPFLLSYPVGKCCVYSYDALPAELPCG